MSQYDFGTIDAATKNGTQLASDLNSWRTALNSCHAGSTRPSYSIAKIIWVNDSTVPWVVNMYDGTADVSIGTVNPTTGTFTPSITVSPTIILSDIQAQTGVAYTTAGTSTAYTLTPTPAITSLVSNQEFDVVFHTSAGTTPTLAISGLTAKSLKYKDSAGSSQSVTDTQVPTGWRSKVVYDGTDYIIREVPPIITPSVRQTVLSGPVDANGFSAFGGSTGATTVTASGTLKATAAGGDANYTGSITNPSWTGLSTNGTMYLYLDITSSSVVTTGSTTLIPIYQWGGTYSTTNGQHTFNIQEMKMEVGNGATASQIYRVFVGEVTVAGNVVTAITWYSIMGRYDSGWTNTLPSVSTAISKNHNIGIKPKFVSLKLKCLTTDAGYAVGDELLGPFSGNMSGAISGSVAPWYTSISCGFTTPDTQSFWVVNKSGGGAYLTLANWAYAMQCERGW